MSARSQQHTQTQIPCSLQILKLALLATAEHLALVLDSDNVLRLHAPRTKLVSGALLCPVTGFHRGARFARQARI